jgi:DNA modification methylase
MKESNVYLEDCMVGMSRYPDKYFDLAIVDPPYGININHNMGRRKGDKHSGHKKVKWDNETPNDGYFDGVVIILNFHLLVLGCFGIKSCHLICLFQWESLLGCQSGKQLER